MHHRKLETRKIDGDVSLRSSSCGAEKSIGHSNCLFGLMTSSDNSWWRCDGNKMGMCKLDYKQCSLGVVHRKFSQSVNRF